MQSLHSWMYSSIPVKILEVFWRCVRVQIVLKIFQCFSHNSENILVAWKYSRHNSESILGAWKYSSRNSESILEAWCRESLYCWKYSSLCYCRQSLVLWTSAHRNHVTPSTLIDMEHCAGANLDAFWPFYIKKLLLVWSTTNPYNPINAKKSLYQTLGNLTHGQCPKWSCWLACHN